MSGYEVAEKPPRLASAWRTITIAVMALAGVVVLAMLVVTVGEANRQRDRALQAQRHSYYVMILSRALQGSVARSEASLGRYVISGDQQFGQSYFDDWRRAGETIRRLEQLTIDNRDQRARVARLRSAYEARGEELALTALNTNYGRNNQALSRFYRARNARSLDAINDTLDGLIAAERQLLRDRTTDAMETVHRSTIAAKVLSVFGIFLLLGIILLGWMMMSALSDRAMAQAEADTERQRADELAEAVAAATDELRTQEARIRQIQKMDAVGQLTGGIAHDFNNMLAVVLGGIELARRNAVAGSEVMRHLESAEEGAVRAAALTKRLLAFARETAINPEPIEAVSLFTGLGELLDRTLGDGVTVVFTDASGGWRTRADRVQLENTIVNLAVNARDAMEGRGTLTIEAGATTVRDEDRVSCVPGDYLTIAVTDTGSGMTPDVLERVFEPFFTTKPVGKGTGLGLSQIFAFTRQIGGDIAISSSPGRGTTVTLMLPRDRSVVAQLPTPLVTETIAAPMAPARALSILVVEDDPRVLAATIDALTELGHVPTPCPDPLLAAETLDRIGHADLIVSDVLMPARTGPEMVATLTGSHALIPVLFVTGFAGEAGTAVDLGGRPVLRKPFTLAGLEAAVVSAAGAGDPANDAEEPLAAE